MIVLRPAESSDYDGVVACLQRNGMPAWTPGQWRALWEEHPSRHDFVGVPRGFVLDADSSIVGTISSLWAKYRFRGRDLRAVVAGRAAVDAEHRANSIRLFGEQLQHAGADLYLNGSASVTTSKVMDAMKVPRVPQAGNDVALLWPARAMVVARVGLSRRRVPLARLFARPVASLLEAASAIRLHSFAKPRGVDEVSRFDSDFDAFWQSMQERTSQLIAVRDRTTLTWRYGPQVAAGEAHVMVARKAGLLVGYAVLVRRPRPSLGVTAYVIHDLQCLNDEGETMMALLSAAWRRTRRDGLDLLEWSGFSGIRRLRAERVAVLPYQLDVWQAYYFTKDPVLRRELAVTDAWSFSSYDSD